LELTSQQWRTSSEVDHPLWKHWLTIVEPRHVNTDVGAMIIGGGGDNDAVPGRVSRFLIFFALMTNSVVSELSTVPNQPLTFAGETGGRSEDDLIAYTWDRYLRTGDESWPARLPMTKSVVRAMDAVTDFCRRNGNGVAVNRFIVGGSSKRGWTTWTTAAVDHRVVGIVPIVIDALNTKRSVEHIYRTYGFWPPSWEPYEKMGILNWIGTPQLDSLLTIEDPFTYRDRLTMPKLIVNSTGDEFFAPDNSRFYFDGLPGQKHLRYLPNSDHSMNGASVENARTILAFYKSVVQGTTPPSFTTHFDDDGSIRVQTIAKPSAVKLWRATNPHARDFRLATIGKAFQSIDLHDQGGGMYVGMPGTPKSGWEASLIAVSYKGVAGQPFTVTTGVRVTPDTLPYGPPHPGGGLR
jgi:PhoPQ-activated pathogenicity-related protein